MVAAPFHFDRTVRCTVVSATGPGIIVNPIALPSAGAPPLPQLRVAFEVDRSISKDPNPASIKIFNLSRFSRERAAGVVRKKVDFSKEFAFIDGRLIEGAALGGGIAEIVETAAGFGYLKLEAGYDGRSAVIFEGGTNRVESERKGPTWITEIRCGDGELSVQKAIANKVFAAGTPVITIIAYLVRTMGLIFGNAATPPPELASVTTSGVACVGRARDCLDQLCAGLNLDWFIDSGEFWLLGESGLLPLPPVPISLIYDQPKKLEDGTIEIRCPLNNLVRPGGSVAMAALSLQGTYRCNRVVFRGDNRSGRYDSTIELQDLSPIAGF